jgi:hypothetical protein
MRRGGGRNLKRRGHGTLEGVIMRRENAPDPIKGEFRGSYEPDIGTGLLLE